VGKHTKPYPEIGLGNRIQRPIEQSRGQTEPMGERDGVERERVAMATMRRGGVKDFHPDGWCVAKGWLLANAAVEDDFLSVAEGLIGEANS
jgi:hypothetical protein